MVPIPTRVWRTTSTSSTNASSGEQPRRPTNTPTARSITLREVLSERSIRFPIFASHYIGLPGNCGAKHWGLNYRSTSRQLAAFVQQRIRHVYRRQRPTPLPSRTAQSPEPADRTGSRASFSVSGPALAQREQRVVDVATAFG